MEIKATLQKPYTEDEYFNFIVQENHGKGYEIKETEEVLEAWGYSQEEIEQQEKERIAKSCLTRGDVFRGLLMAKQVTRAEIRAMIENNETLSTSEKEMALIDFDEALNFYRGNPLIDTLGLTLGITTEQLDKFFETNDYTVLLTVEETTEESNKQESLTNETVL